MVRENEIMLVLTKETAFKQVREKSRAISIPRYLSFSPVKPFSYLSHLSGLNQDRVKSAQGAGRAVWSLRNREPGAVCHEVGIPQCPGKVSRAGLEMCELQSIAVAQL